MEVQKGKGGIYPVAILFVMVTLLTNIVVQVLLSLLRVTPPLSGTVMAASKKA